MNKPRNIYRFDDVCLVLAGVLVAVALWLAWPAIAAAVDQGAVGWALVLGVLGTGRLAAVAGVLGSALVLALAGVAVRRRERAMLAVLGPLVDVRLASVPSLAAETGMSEERVSRLVDSLVRSRVLPIVREGDRVRVLEAWPGAARGDSQPGAAPVHTGAEPVRLVAGDGAPLPGSQPAGADGAVDLAALAGLKENKLSIPVAVFLFLVFWPFGLLYVAQWWLRGRNAAFLRERLGLGAGPGDGARKTGG